MLVFAVSLFWLCALAPECCDAVNKATSGPLLPHPPTTTLSSSSFISLSVTNKTTELTTSNSSTTWPIQNITLGPSVKINYTARVTTTAPAVLDSLVTFEAQVFRKDNGTLHQEEKIAVPPEPQAFPFIPRCEGEEKRGELKFEYEWLNTADRKTERCVGSEKAMLKRTFDGEKVPPGQYIMTVIIKPKDKPNYIIAYDSTMFRLTQHLNGKLNIAQDLEYQRKNNTFAVDKKMKFDVNVTDQFSQRLFPDFAYYWYNGSQLLHKTSLPKFEQTFRGPGVLQLQASVYASSWELPVDKDGTFAEQIDFKESLSNCSTTRVDSNVADQSLKLGTTLLLNITCLGSSPSVVCWNVTGLNGTLNETCRPPRQFDNTTYHTVSVSIHNTGWSTLHLTVYNDVSLLQMTQDFYVYDADDVNIPALVFPVVFIIIGLVIAVIGGTYIVRLRRKLHVEVADFDFDPSITVTVRGSRSLSNLSTAVKQIVARFRGPDNSASYNNNLPRRMHRPHSMYETL